MAKPRAASGTPISTLAAQVGRFRGGASVVSGASTGLDGLKRGPAGAAGFDVEPRTWPGAVLPDFLDFGFELTFRGPCKSAGVAWE
jgi:hypothetical protein